MEHAPLQPQPDNTYIIDTESAAEMARLMRQDKLFTKGMGGIFPEKLDLTGVQRILDVACGPGGWVLETAFAHADIDVVGVDISQTMINYACAQAHIQHLENASFAVMNATQPLDFPDHSFDLINARMIVGFMLPEKWPSFIQECLRILRPGGILRFTDIECGLTTAASFEKNCFLFNQALAKAHQSFSPNGFHMGILPALSRFLPKAGCQNCGHMAHAIDFSSGTEAHEGFYHDFASALKLVQPFILKTGIATPEELDELYAQTLVEMQEEDFCALLMVLTVWGQKPDAV